MFYSRISQSIKYLKKSEKKRAIPSLSEHFKFGMGSLGEELRKEISPKVLENNTVFHNCLNILIGTSDTMCTT